MTEITRVPLQPIAKGSLTKLWLGVAAAIAVAGGIAYAAMPPLVGVKTIKAGEGLSPSKTDVVLINYTGMLSDGKVFDKGESAVMPVDGVVPGFASALQQMQKGGQYKVKIPAKLAYGDKASGPIPANSDLTFEIQLLDFKSRAEIEQQRQMMEQLRAMQGGGQGGGAGGAQGMPQGMPQGAPEAGAEAPAHP